MRLAPQESDFHSTFTTLKYLNTLPIMHMSRVSREWGSPSPHLVRSIR